MAELDESAETPAEVKVRPAVGRTASGRRESRSPTGSPGPLAAEPLVLGEAAALHGGNVFRIAREKGWDWRDVLDFSANINPLGIPGSVRAAVEHSLDRVRHYPDIGAPDFRRAAASAWGVEHDQILAGNGATELLYFLVRALKPRRAHLVTPTFTEYRRALHESEITTSRCSIRDGYAPQLPRIAADVRRHEVDLLVLTNPNNPTGNVIRPERLLAWLKEELPENTRVLLDESFADFTDQLSLVAATGHRRGLFVLRSLTKFYALPGLRLGCLVGHREDMQPLERVREPWQTNVLAEQAGVAALGDEDYRRDSLAFVRAERHWLREQLAKLPGLTPFPSAANFVFVHCGRSVSELQAFLLPHKVLIRDLTGVEGVDGHAFRIAVRTRRENAQLIGLLEAYLS